MKSPFFEKTRFLPVCFTAALMSAGAVPSPAEDYLGARTVLQQVEERNTRPVEKSATSEQQKLRDQLKAFSREATNLPPAEAARRWLDLADQACKLQRTRDYSDNRERPIDADELFGALPPPTAWPALAKAVAARKAPKRGDELREAGFRFLADTLTGDTESRQREAAAVRARAQDAGSSAAYFYNDWVRRWTEAIATASENPDVVLRSLEYQLTTGAGGRQSVRVPNLVAQVGPEKAEAFLKKALGTANVTLQFSQPNETSRLAQKLALADINRLKSPQWGLINSLDAVELYEAMDKKFGAETNGAGVGGDLPRVDFPPMDGDFSGQGKDAAQTYYMLGLISRGRSKDAVAVAKKIGQAGGQYISEQAIKEMEHAGYTVALDKFFYEALSQDPTIPFWDEYVNVAAGAGQTDRMLALVRRTAARDDLSDTKKNAVKEVLIRALLAADKVDEGVQEIRRVTSTDIADPSGAFNVGQWGLSLARIGMLEQKPEWTEQGIQITRKWLASPAAKSARSWESRFIVPGLAQVLADLGRGPEAERVLEDALANATRPGGNRNEFSLDEDNAQTILAELAGLYHRAGRSDDVLTLFQQSPAWGVKDLSGLSGVSTEDNGAALVGLHTGSSALPVYYLAADAFLASGNREQARKITDELLSVHAGLDRGYELLLALDGTNALPRLDALFKQDPFEERPLIWKAHLLRQQNRLDEAEKAARQAIAIDPSDGEEGRGDRMRVYAELADILDARGNKKDADFYREIVKSIRMSEDADQFYQAGLLKHAIGMYEEALTHFADAYCIQSRLAIQLSELGQNDAAEEHYRRAYELMPDSFGRVESHCFGCERAFDGERAQSIAEKVFTKIAAERPDKPQVHYLLGYLRMEQERYNEARLNFLAAVRLDPDYLNAWIKMNAVSDQVLMPAKDRDDIVFNILRLDPLQEHGCSNFNNVSDLPRLWNAVAAAQSRAPVRATNLLTLAASKAALEKKADSGTDRNSTMYWRSSVSDWRDTAGSPGRAIAETSFVRLAGELIFNNTED